MIVNPVLAKELRDRVRTWRSPLLIMLYLTVMGGIAFIIFYLETANGMGGAQTLRLGITIFALLSILQLGLISCLVPGMTGGIISGERERQTLPLLLVTKLSPLAVTSGKLLSAISYIVLLIVAAIPLYSIVFLFGGVSLRQFFLPVLVYFMTTLTLASIGLLCSALFKRTVTAVVVSYGITLFGYAGTVFIATIIVQLHQRVPMNPMPRPAPFIVNFNPLVALGSTFPMNMGLVPFSQPSTDLVKGWPVWAVNSLLDLGIIIIALGLTVWLIHPLRSGRRRGD